MNIQAEWFTGFSSGVFISTYLTHNPIICDCNHVGSFAAAENRYAMLEDDGMMCNIEKIKGY